MSLGEISHLPKNLALNTKCSCGADVHDCPIWKPIVLTLNEKLDTNLATNPYALNTGYPKATTVVDRNRQTRLYLLKRKFAHGLVYLEQRFGLNLLKSCKHNFYDSLDARFMLYDTIREKTGADIVIDSSKTYLEGLSLYRKNPEEVRIIILSRDGRGVMYSNMKRNLGRKNGLIGWLHYYSRFLKLLERHVAPEHALNIHYEDLALNTKVEIGRICEFLQVDYEESMLNFSSSEHHITNGNDMRFSASSEIRIDADWQKNLSEHDLQYFEHKAGNLSRKMGYP